MLILSRKLGEAIVIDGRITVTIVDLRGGRVQLGISAPPEVPIHRDEVFARVRRELLGEERVTLDPAPVSPGG